MKLLRTFLKNLVAMAVVFGAVIGFVGALCGTVFVLDALAKATSAVVALVIYSAVCVVAVAGVSTWAERRK